jgi:hypothetical protein
MFALSVVSATKSLDEQAVAVQGLRKWRSPAVFGNLEYND